jgi:hypothetical protein
MMTRTFEEMCAERDPLYQRTRVGDSLTLAIAFDFDAAFRRENISEASASRAEMARDAELHKLAIRALRNQGEPYYDRP